MKDPAELGLSGLRKVEARMREIKDRFEKQEKKTIPLPFVTVMGEAVKKDDLATKERSTSLADDIPGYDFPRGGDGRVPEEILDEMILRKARKYGVDENIVRAVIQMESGGKAHVVSSAGAMGLMQLMPSTAKMLGVEDAFDPEQNMDGGVRYLKMMLDRYKGDERLALAAYHSGPARVDNYGGIPPFPIVNRYVKTVMAITEKARRE